MATDTSPSLPSLAWSNLSHRALEWTSHSWTSPLLWGHSKCLLAGLSGSFHPGTLNGLMGPSGAGKTTLLNCLAGKVTSTSGIWIRKPVSRPIVSYFIPQHVHETLQSGFTVLQILVYAFRFKNGLFQSSSTLEGHLQTIMKQLLLPEELLDRQVGKCSGGELKRLAIAQELMSLVRPDYLFIDEPTTGLDSTAALQVLTCLKSLTEVSPITIIVSIHVPNHECLELFNQLYVLAKGGRAIYSGPPAGISHHLERVLRRKVTEEGEQPIEALIRLACKESSTSVAKLASDCQKVESLRLSTQTPSLQQSALPNTRQRFRLPDFYLQLCRYLNLIFISGWKLCLKQLLVYVSVICSFIAIFNQEMVQPDGCASRVDSSSAGNVSCFNQLDNSALLKENVTFLNLSVHVFVYIIMAGACVAVRPLVKVFKSEHGNKWYSLGTFYFSFTAVTLLQLTLIVAIISLLLYFVSGQYTIDVTSSGHLFLNWTRLGHYTFCLLLYALFVQSLGYLLGTVFLGSSIFPLISSFIVYTLIMMINDFYIRTGELRAPLFVSFTDWIGVKYLIRYLVYIFYGIDRCRAEEGRFSYILIDYDAENSSQIIWSFTRSMLLNSALLRLASLAILYFKFSGNDMAIFRKILELSQRTGQVAKVAETPVKSPLPRLVTQFISQLNGKPTSLLTPDQQNSSIILAWRNLSLFGSSSLIELKSSSGRDRRQRILTSVSGQFTFGSLNALMGPSGSGKTSLLRVLNGQNKDRLSLETSFYLSRHTRIRSCFLTQDVSDHLWPGLTAKQSLLYASQLKNASLGSVAHEGLVWSLLQQLDLVSAADTPVERCSGGERKRLALAQELTPLEMPNLVCIDEPTSGLDSHSAEVVIATLRSLASRHSLAIITSIHQPNTQILKQFNEIYVLARGGVCIYSGPPGDLHARLSRLPVETGTTPGDAAYSHETLINYSYLGAADSTVSSLVELNNRELELKSGKLLEACQHVPDGLTRPRLRFSLTSSFLLTQRYLTYFTQSQLLNYTLFCLFLLFFGRSILFFWQIHALSPKFSHPFCINLAEDDTSTDSHDCSASSTGKLEDFRVLRLVSTFTFFLHLIFIFLATIQGAAHFFSEYPRLRNEHRNGWYSLGTFYLMKSTLELLQTMPILLLYFWLASLSTEGSSYWTTVGLMTLCLVAMQGMCHLIVILAHGSLLLQFMLQISAQLMFAFIGNFFIALPHLHYLAQWAANLSISRFTHEALTVLLYGFGRCDAKREIQPLLYWMGITDDSYLTHCLLMMVGLAILYRGLAIWLLSKQLNPPENRREREECVSNWVSNLKPSGSIVFGLDCELGTKLSNEK